MLHMKSLKAGALVLGLSLIAAVSIAAAQPPGNNGGQPESGMMGNRGSGMMGNGSGMMGMMGVDTAQMNRMIENCNRLMESMMQTPPTTPSSPKG